MNRKSWLLLSAFSLALSVSGGVSAKPADAPHASDPEALNTLTWRNIGPFRGGRVTTGVGVPGQPKTYYMGATGGGVWKTDNGGNAWRNISDGFFKTGSIGDIAVYQGDPKIIYVGTGEAPVRGQMSSYGDGVYKSTDAGKTWTNVGLEKTRQISRVIVHPTNPNLVYVAAQGDRWKATDDRGIYRSTDGGATWSRILFSSRIAGPCELVMDPHDPKVLYAAFWDQQRQPWEIRSGGPGSGVWKSTDGGDHWTQLKTGLPAVMGKIRLAVAPSNPNRVYASIENEHSGLFRSDDAGATWKQVNQGDGFITRPWYYLGVQVDPKNPDVVYVSASSLIKSTDGGQKFVVVPTRHTDTHTLWINPADPNNMIETDDGGAEVSFDGAKTWSPVDNQSTAQLYAVQADDKFPYNIYSGQQDSGPIMIASRASGANPRNNFKISAGGESSRFAFDPKDPRFVYGTAYLGATQRLDTLTGLSRTVAEWAGGQHLGVDAGQMTYRYNWSAPLTWSPFDPHVMYHGANVLFRSDDQGTTWKAISPDLTRNEASKHGRSGLWWHDGSGGEIYNDIYAIAESPVERGTIWVGTDDGLVQVTRDGGQTWTKVSPPGWGEGWVYTVDASPTDKGVAYVAFSRHRQGDYTPHLFKTADYGKTWTDLAKTLPQSDPARVIRQDPVRKGLLYAATEYAVWISFDDGAHWRSFQQNLPKTPIGDLTIHNGDLIAGTEGRGIWIMDDITPLEQMTPEAASADLFLFKPRDTYRADAGGRGEGGGRGPRPAGPTNPPNGVILRYSLARAADPKDILKLEILDGQGQVVRSLDSKAPAARSPEGREARSDDEREEARERDRSPKGRGGRAAEAAEAAEAKEAQSVAVQDQAAQGHNPPLATGDRQHDTASGAKAPAEPPEREAREREAEREAPKPQLTLQRGLNQAVWDFRGETLDAGGHGRGPLMPAGRYTARLTLGETVASQSFDLLIDPRTDDTVATEQEHTALAREIMAGSAEMSRLANEVRGTLNQAKALQTTTKDHPSPERDAALQSLIAQLQALDAVYQPGKGGGGHADPGGQTVLDTGSGPVGDFSGLQSEVDGGTGPVTQGERLRAEELKAVGAKMKAATESVLKDGVAKVNALDESLGLKITIVPRAEPGAPPIEPMVLDEEEETEGYMPD